MKLKFLNSFLAFSLALCSLTLQAEPVAAGLKGTYDGLPADVQQYSPLLGAVLANNGEINTMLASTDASQTNDLAKKMFKVVNDTTYITTHPFNPVAMLQIQQIVTLLQHIRTDKPCTDLLFKNADQSIENLTGFGNAWFEQYKGWKTGDTIPKKQKLFLEDTPTFLQTLDAAVKENKARTIQLLLAFVYLKAQSPQDLHTVFKQFHPALANTIFTNDDYENFTKLFTETELSEAALQGKIEELVFWLLQRKASSLYFLRVPQQYFVNKKGKEVPTCVEGAIQTIVNGILIDCIDCSPDQQLLTLKNLPTTVTPSKQLQEFIKNHNNPHIPDYYKTTLTDSMGLFSGVKGVTYMRSGKEEVAPLPKNVLAVLNTLFGTQAKNFKELGKMLSSDTRTIAFTEGTDLEEDDELNFSEEQIREQDWDEFEEHIIFPDSPPAADDDSDSDDSASESDSDDDADTDDGKKFITTTITLKNSEHSITLRTTLNEQKNHGETNFVDSSGRVLPLPTLENITKAQKIVGQALINLASVDWYRTLVKYWKDNIFPTGADFLKLLQTHPITAQDLLKPSDSQDYLIDDIIYLGRLDYLKALADFGIDLVNAPTEMKVSTLEHSLGSAKAITAGIPEYLIEQGAPFDPETITKITSHEKNGRNYESSPFSFTLNQDNLVAVEKLLQLGANPNALLPRWNLEDPSIVNETPLQKAIANRMPKLTALLLKYGANPNDTYGGSPLLSYAMGAKNPLYAELLLQHRANPNVMYGDTPIIYSALYNPNPIYTELLLKYKADPNLENPNGYSPLHYSYSIIPEGVTPEATLKKTELLLQHGANPNKPDQSGYTPLQRALLLKESKLLELLLTYGADPREQLLKSRIYALAVQDLPQNLQDLVKEKAAELDALDPQLAEIMITGEPGVIEITDIEQTV